MKGKGSEGGRERGSPGYRGGGLSVNEWGSKRVRR